MASFQSTAQRGARSLLLLEFQNTLINRYIDKDPNCAAGGMTLSDRGSCAVLRLCIERSRLPRVTLETRLGLENGRD
jgi:hypothetical protein